MGKVILLVEDTSSDEKLTLMAFKRCGVANEVVVTRDGAEALDYLFCTGDYAARDPDRPPKLVLLDIKMPKVDGIEVLRQVKENARTRLIPVVVMTSSNEEKDVVESYRLGVNSYIVKPIEFAVFFDTVSKIGLYWVLTNRVPE